MDSGRTVSADVALTGVLTRVVADGVVQVDALRRVVCVNSAVEAITGLPAEQFVGKDVSELFQEPIPQEIFPRRASEHPLESAVTVRTRGGEALKVCARSAAVVREDHPERWVIAFSPRRLDEIEQLKSELVATVSHELKTPLAAIKAYTSTLRGNPDLYDERKDEFLEIVESQADRLTRLVDDMLLIARVDSGQMLRRRVLVPLDEILDDALAELPLDEERHRIERNTQSVLVSGDPERLRHVFRNLIENAIKYSPGGGTIDIFANENAGRTTVAIRDQGVGIEQEHLPYTFERFFRVDSEVGARAGGSGLGLSIVQAMVRAHGGTIEVESVPGSGSTFTLNLPVRS